MTTTTDTTTQQAAPAPVRFVGKCKACKKAHRIEGAMVRSSRTDRATVAGVDVSFWNGAWQASLECCPGPYGQPRRVLLRKVYDALGPNAGDAERHECGARCLSSTGPSCECKCRGRNHGRG
jgi:hypothetical protein